METERVNKLYESLTNIYNLSPVAKDPFSSTAPCLCGSVLAGLRHEFTGTAGKKHSCQILTFECCVDCFEQLFT